MPFQVGPEVTRLVGLTRAALGLTQRTLGEAFGASMRTAHRWEAGKSYPGVDQVQRMARRVYPVDAQLAAELAAAAGTDLQALGLVRPAPVVAAAPPAPQEPPPRPFPPVSLMVDSVVLAALEVTDGQTSRQSVRDILRAGFARARGLGLTVDEVDAALAPPSPAKTPPTRK
jgi:transcriptional regulator with XRE-family HTH domain